MGPRHDRFAVGEPPHLAVDRPLELALLLLPLGLEHLSSQALGVEFLALDRVEDLLAPLLHLGDPLVEGVEAQAHLAQVLVAVGPGAPEELGRAPLPQALERGAGLLHEAMRLALAGEALELGIGRP